MRIEKKQIGDYTLCRGGRLEALPGLKAVKEET